MNSYRQRFRARIGVVVATLCGVAWIARSADAHAATSFAERLEEVTRRLVGARYVLSPLGEGAPPDPDPRLRFDAFDCTTFVETAIALASCDGGGDGDQQRDADRDREGDSGIDPGRLRARLDVIRYEHGVPSFENRRHLITSQWIPGLLSEALVEDITASVGEQKTRTILLEATSARWKRRRIARSLHLADGTVPKGVFRLDIVPLEFVSQRIERIPAGTVLNVVRSNVPWAPELVTHQALVLTKKGVRIARHASPVGKRVIDETLEHMVARYVKPKTPRKWPVLGINLLRILEPAPTSPLCR